MRPSETLGSELRSSWPAPLVVRGAAPGTYRGWRGATHGGSPGAFAIGAFYRNTIQKEV